MKTKCNKCGTITTRQNGIEDRMGGGTPKEFNSSPNITGSERSTCNFDSALIPKPVYSGTTQYFLHTHICLPKISTGISQSHHITLLIIGISVPISNQNLLCFLCSGNRFIISKWSTKLDTSGSSSISPSLSLVYSQQSS